MAGVVAEEPVAGQPVNSSLPFYPEKCLTRRFANVRRVPLDPLITDQKVPLPEVVDGFLSGRKGWSRPSLEGLP